MDENPVTLSAVTDSPATAKRTALLAAVHLHSSRRGRPSDDLVLATAAAFTRWLLAPPARLMVRAEGLTFEQGDPSKSSPTHQKRSHGGTMAVTMTDTQEVVLTCQAEDATGAPVGDNLSWTSDDNGQYVTLQPSSDGTSCTVVAVGGASGIGTANVSVTAGHLSGGEAVTIDPGAATQLVVHAGTPTAQSGQ